MRKQVVESGIVSDANILIDYLSTEPNILDLISKNVQKLYVPVPILREVKQLNQDYAKKLGLEIIEPTLAQYNLAVKIKQANPALSNQDSICFAMAKVNNWACLTNDKPLRHLCNKNGITVLWGIGIMHKLVSANVLSSSKAVQVALKIKSQNRHITNEIVDRFREQLGL